MEAQRVLIVAITEASADTVCVGAMTQDGLPVRLTLPGFQPFFAADRAPAPGAILDITGRQSADLRPPHVEDFVIDEWTEIETIQGGDVARLVRARAVNHSADGRLLDTFESRLTRKANSVLLWPGCTPPPYSVWFWTTDQAIPVQGEKHRVHAHVETGRAPHSKFGHPARIPMKGLDALDWVNRTIPAGALLRLSLSRPWSDGDPSDACWLQISGVVGMLPAE